MATRRYSALNLSAESAKPRRLGNLRANVYSTLPRGAMGHPMGEQPTLPTAADGRRKLSCEIAP
jgi:hypothetical protein